NQNVWKLVPLPEGKTAIGIKWILKNKRDARGIVVRNKARLVAQGHRQEEGINYDEVFALVVRIEAIRLFLAFASYMGFLAYQMDVKSAFLYGEIEEEVYGPSKSQAGLQGCKGIVWTSSSTKGLNSRDIILVQVYVDDIIFGSTKKAWCDEFEKLMKSEFEMSAMGELTFFLGLQVKQQSDGIFIHQEKYVHDILKKFDLENLQDLISCLQLVLVQDIIDLAFVLEAYSDSDYAGAHGDRKFTTGGCQFLGRRLISWQCKKQTIVATSSTEAEYVAAANCYGQECGASESAGVYVSSLHSQHICSYAHMLVKCFAAVPISIPSGRILIVPAGSILQTLKGSKICLGLDQQVVSEPERDQKQGTYASVFPEDHMADFHHLDDARDIWLAVKARFRGNEESKKMRKSMLKPEFQEFRVSEDEGLHKGYDRFQKILSQLNQLQAKPDNEDCSNVSHFNFGNVMEDVLHSFVAESDQQIIYEDFDQIGKLDLEELDIKWQMAMLSVRVNRFEKKAGRKMNFNNRDAARFDKKKVRCYKCFQLGYFARECTGKQVESNARYYAFKIKELEQDKQANPKALLFVDSMVNWSDHEESADENASQVYGMIAGCDDKKEY
ncbi:putative ribonuclease H-like domain-containing protein, partial [Tanacetum coccineum]